MKYVLSRVTIKRRLSALTKRVETLFYDFNKKSLNDMEDELDEIASEMDSLAEEVTEEA